MPTLPTPGRVGQPDFGYARLHRPGSETQGPSTALRLAALDCVPLGMTGLNMMAVRNTCSVRGGGVLNSCSARDDRSKYDGSSKYLFRAGWWSSEQLFRSG